MFISSPSTHCAAADSSLKRYVIVEMSSDTASQSNQNPVTELVTAIGSPTGSRTNVDARPNLWVRPTSAPELPSAAIVPDPVHASRHLELLARLAVHLDPESLLTTLFDFLSDKLAVEGVGYRHKTSHLNIVHGQRRRHRISYALVPSGAEHLGELQLNRQSPFSTQEQAELEALLPLFMLALRNALLHQAAVQSALTDALTNTGNRLSLNTAGKHEIQVAARHGMPMSLLLVDIDNFKPVNDTYGHAYGDEVLRLLAAALCQAVRRADEVYRYGGEEFVVLLANTDQTGALAMAERIRVLVAANPAIRAQHPTGITVSIGSATLRENDTLDTLCNRADMAMYQAKRSGRNRVISEGQSA